MAKTLIIGASENPERYAYKAAMSLLKHQHEIVLFAVRPGELDGHSFITEFPDKIDDLDTIALYINPSIQLQYYAKILALKPKRIIFNPGTESEEFERMCEAEHIDVQESCTLVMLSTGQY